MFAAFPTEQSAIDHLTSIRWAEGKFCPLCDNRDGTKIGTLAGTNTHKCYVCRKRFSIKVGTIFQDTKLPLRTWYAAIWMITNHPKGIASTTLATDLGITQKTAWFVLHRLRAAARTNSFRPSRWRWQDHRQWVWLRRTARSALAVIDSRDGRELYGVIAHHVEPGSTVVTDQHMGYKTVSRAYDHKTVNHRRGEYVKDGFTTNGVESIWALFKRQYHGTHHWISPKHLDAYLGEMAFRLNRRDLTKGERVNGLLSQVEGPLPYKVLIA
jgi:transposase-like protein